MKNPYRDMPFDKLETVLWRFSDIYAFHFRQHDPLYVSRPEHRPEAPIEKQIVMVTLAECEISRRRKEDPKGASYLLSLVEVLKALHGSLELKQARDSFGIEDSPFQKSEALH